jgi:exodeoxyribonuclease VII large subunit
MASWRDMVESTAPESPTDPAVESVSALTRRVKYLLEAEVGSVWVRGEVSNLRRQASGHSYFGLKDGRAQISCVLFRGEAARQTVELADGQQLVIGGRLSVYEARGQYQLVVQSIKDDGVGRLQREFELLKRRLADEGLFDAERKKSLPALPLRIAIVTSPTGAAVQDFVRILVRREWRGRLTVVPARVQGAEAGAEVIAGIEWANAARAFDVVVVARGGGSLEDLWTFNEEPVVRAIAASELPVISAIGHEIDFALSDFVADVRAETPSGAAELLSSSYRNLSERLERAARNLRQEVDAALEVGRRDLRGLRDRLRLLTPQSQVEQGWQRRDELAGRLRAGLNSSLRQARQRLAISQSAWRRCDPQLTVERESQRLLSLWKRLQSVSPQATLRRGFTLVRDGSDRPVVTRAGLEPDGRYEIEFADGRREIRPVDDE